MRWRVALGLLLSALLTALLLASVDLVELARLLARVDPWLLLAAVGLYFAGALVRSLRWRLLLLPIAEVPVGRLFRVLIIGFTANDLLPARVGELARAYLLGRSHRIPAATTLASIVIERVLDGLTLCLFIGIAWLFLPGAALLSWLGALVAAGFVVGAAALWVVAGSPSRLVQIAFWLQNRLPGRVRARATRLATTFTQGLGIMRQGRLLGAALALSLVAWAFEAGMYFLIAVALALPLGPLAAALGVGVANLGTMIPAAPGYIGTFDVPLAGTLALVLGVPRDAAIGYTLLVHAALVLPVVLLGLLLAWHEGVSLRTVARSPNASQGTVPRRDSSVARALD